MPTYLLMWLHVAPFVGAWIETRSAAFDYMFADVAPFVGAWIETKDGLNASLGIFESHPLWVRGLKQLLSTGNECVS